MRGHLRLPFAWLAIVAMIVTLLPQTLWACPMTGRVDSASRVCAGLMVQTSGDVPCAHMGGKCCKPLSVPPAQNDDNPHQSQTLITVDKGSLWVTLAPPPSTALPFVLVASSSIQPVAQRLVRAPYDEPPPSFWTQHRPITCAGRAPPVL